MTENPRDIDREEEGQRVLDENRAWEHALAQALIDRMAEDARKDEAEADFDTMTNMHPDISECDDYTEER